METEPSHSSLYLRPSSLHRAKAASTERERPSGVSRSVFTLPMKGNSKQRGSGRHLSAKRRSRRRRKRGAGQAASQEATASAWQHAGSRSYRASSPDNTLSLTKTQQCHI
ncbi:hypothetical protein SKAU_G00337860 [Synaphobranchus kaupii]|uniref:Uncharacterized protein n=1 Tax=Synaphobranchus kaupii TaxID=118154 RepID=A0A9Q1EMC7_SYNKA|nr:hypothetical protein SKAU_G00337860 [Synaphobranchus kaupii]